MDPQTKKRSLRNITYGVYVLTVRSGEKCAGAMVTWVSQASLDPPKIMLGLKKGGHTAELVENVKGFTLNILGESQKKLAADFLKHAVIEDERINGYLFKTGKTGAPILRDTPSYLECEIDRIIEGADHNIVIAEVIDAGVQSDELPLNLRSTGWSYGG
jgi:flavin reductase (DIM6/NTAB) family NADH-FMN oxidoreductase RutF